ncbi:hypothetical protein ABZW18_01045 [Streptomyces sp. NPDC004647]|uniref:hypothetical protein n=1 Tax=Streptomyces sp. NPDC004647 TaxID=3154671 RepID=UPI00339FFEC9
MAADGWARAVRQQLGLGRILPLGGPADGSWITEKAASQVLMDAASEWPGIRPEAVRVSLADPDSAPEPAVVGPVSALPPGPLRIEAEFSASALLPLPEAAEQLRRVLFEAAEARLGLVTTEVDLRVTGLIDEPEPGREPSAATSRGSGAVAGEPAPASDQAPAPGPRLAPGPVPVREPTVELGEAAAAVPGVARLAATLGFAVSRIRAGQGHPVEIKDDDDPPRRRVQVQLAVTAGQRALDVARNVRAVVAAAAAGDAPGPVTVAVLVTAVEPRPSADAGAARPARALDEW